MTGSAARAERERRAAIALDCERLGHPREAWGVWERLRADFPDCSDWNAPLVASYLGFALDWTAETGAGSLEDALQALERALGILATDLARDEDDVTRWIVVARALEQRCMLYAFGQNWTAAVRNAVETGDPAALPAPSGDARLVRAAAGAAKAALDMLAARPDLPRLLRAQLDLGRARIETVEAHVAERQLAARRAALTVVEGGRAENAPRTEPLARPRLMVS